MRKGGKYPCSETGPKEQGYHLIAAADSLGNAQIQPANTSHHSCHEGKQGAGSKENF